MRHKISGAESEAVSFTKCVSGRSRHLEFGAGAGGALVPFFLLLHITQQVEGKAIEVALFQLEGHTHTERL